MYNEAIKKKFIYQFDYNAKYMRTCFELFKKTEPYEAAWGKDLYAVSSFEDMQKMYAEVTDEKKSHGLHSKLLILRRYIEWCKANGAPNVSDCIYQIVTPEMEVIRTKMVSGPADLQKYLDAVFEPLKEERLSVIHRCYFWLAFSGLEENSIFLVNDKDINFNKKLVSVGGLSYPLYTESIPALKKAVTLDSFNYYSDDDYNDRQHRRPRATGNTLMRGFRVEHNYKQMSQHLANIAKDALNSKKVSKRLNYFNTELSGYFYKKLEQEASFGILDYAAFLDRAEAHSVPNKVEKRARDFLKDYENWKLAFDL